MLQFKRPVITKRTVIREKPKQPPNANGAASASSRASPAASSSSSSKPVQRRPEPAHGKKRATSSPIPVPAKRLNSPAPRHGTPPGARRGAAAPKRKAPTPSLTQWDSSSSESEGEGPGSGGGDAATAVLAAWRRLGPNDILEPDAEREMADDGERSKDDGGVFEMVHGADLTGGEGPKNFSAVFEGDDGRPLVVELQYPSASQKER